jgi:myo-inositol-1-phosphate synthase
MPAPTDSNLTLLFLGVLLGLGPVLLAWVQLLEHWRGKKQDLSQFVTQTQLAAIKSERDVQIKSTFDLLNSKMDDVKATIDRLDEDLRQVRGDMPSLHRALGKVEGHDAAEARKRPR